MSSTSSDDEVDGGAEPLLFERRRVSSMRRFGVSAEEVNTLSNEQWVPPVYGKSLEERERLVDIINHSHDGKVHMMFGNVPKETFEKIIDAMFMKQVPLGESVIEQGADGDYFYIVKSGSFTITVKKGADPPKKVFEAGAGFAFGELALLYNAPRSATITASVESDVWCLERAAFRNLVVKSSEEQFKQSLVFISKCDVFQELDDEQRAALAEVLAEEEFENDEAIVEQGERDDKMYIVRKGKSVACIHGDQGEVEVKQYNQGDYFGEIALLYGHPRKASVYAVDKCTCAYISREAFHRILGPLCGFLSRNIEKYEKYQDAIRMATSEEEGGVDIPKNASNMHSSGTTSPVSPARRKLRVRAAENSSKIETTSGVSRPASEIQNAEPATLAEKVAHDLRNSNLITPPDKFDVAKSQLRVFGLLRLGERFMVDKKIHVRAKATPVSNGLEDTYCWNGMTHLKRSTHIGVVCQKGQKSASDPTPNQDNYFILHVGDISLYGVCDGHGPFGHLISFRIVQALPHFLLTNRHFGEDWPLALKQAFAAAQEELLEFCGQYAVNTEASGCSCSVAILAGQTVHFAHIGDSTAMLACWNKNNSRLIYSTSDHKPDLPEERARLEAAGSEVREAEGGGFRIYLPGSSFPGLSMSRCFGDTGCKGVSQEPVYRQFQMQPSDENYLIIASDGVWEFIEPDKAVELVSKKLRLKGPRETLRFLVEASRKRWTQYCGDYCDDITALLVQWNVNEKGSSTNHTLSLQRHE